MRSVLRAAFLLSLVFAVLWARQPVRARRAMVVTGEPHATDAGLAVLQSGGNAVDAAVAVGFALGVTHSAMCGLGGGGYMLVRFADGRSAFLDFRERAPQAASRNMFLDAQGKPTEDSTSGWRAAGVPGTVRGFELAVQKFGRKPWSELVRPAVELAARGYPISYQRAQELKNGSKLLARFPESKRIFLRGGVGYGPDERFIQPELADTLRRIAASGAREFYEGITARRLAAAMDANGGLITLADLKSYAAIERAPLQGRYRNYDILTAPPSSSGGVALLQMLGILEGSGYEKHGSGSAAAIHFIAEAMRRVYADRGEYAGDPDFVRVPVSALLSKKYLAALRSQIDPDRATPSEKVRPGNLAAYESAETTHYSIVDAEGNAVAVTFTLNGLHGSGVTVPELGFLLNNNMDNFAALPGGPNRSGLIQGEASAIQPGKRPVSSMTPSILLRDGKLFMVVGTPGGPTITTAVLQAIVNVVDFGMNVQEAINFPRFHHQWMPDQLSLESGFSPDTIQLLKARGHAIHMRPYANDMNAIISDGGWLEGATDPRRAGRAAGY